MDSLTQIVLGAAMGEVALGKKLGNKAMLWGAVGGTIPDFDVFIRFFTDEISAAEMHRGFSHSLVFALIMSPILGWLLHKLYRKYPEVTFKNWTWLFFLSIVTHPLLDAHTTWGTQFFWPFEYRLAYQNIFVVDPLYTIPFLIFLILAMFYKKGSKKRRRFNSIGIIVSSFYMILTLVFKGVAHHHFENALEKNQISYVELDTKPTPLNSFLWMAEVKTTKGIRVAYYSIFDKEDIYFSHEYLIHDELLKPYKNQKVIQQIIKISNGWYFIEPTNKGLLFYDVRFGQFGVDPDKSPFLWSYVLTDKNGQIQVKRNQMKLNNMSQSLSDLFERI